MAPKNRPPPRTSHAEPSRRLAAVNCGCRSMQLPVVTAVSAAPFLRNPHNRPSLVRARQNGALSLVAALAGFARYLYTAQRSEAQQRSCGFLGSRNGQWIGRDSSRLLSSRLVSCGRVNPGLREETKNGTIEMFIIRGDSNRMARPVPVPAASRSRGGKLGS